MIFAREIFFTSTFTTTKILIFHNFRNDSQKLFLIQKINATPSSDVAILRGKDSGFDDADRPTYSSAFINAKVFPNFISKSRD